MKWKTQALWESRKLRRNWAFPNPTPTRSCKSWMWGVKKQGLPHDFGTSQQTVFYGAHLLRCCSEREVNLWQYIKKKKQILGVLSILSDKFHKQMCLRLIYREWIWVIPERPKSLENAGLLGYGIALWQQNDNILDYPRIKSYLISVREVR